MRFGLGIKVKIVIEVRVCFEGGEGDRDRVGTADKVRTAAGVGAVMYDGIR